MPAVPGSPLPDDRPLLPGLPVGGGSNRHKSCTSLYMPQHRGSTLRRSAKKEARDGGDGSLGRLQVLALAAPRRSSRAISPGQEDSCHAGTRWSIMYGTIRSFPPCTAGSPSCCFFFRVQQQQPGSGAPAKPVPVTFLPSKATVQAQPGQTLKQVAVAAKVRRRVQHSL